MNEYAFSKQLFGPRQVPFRYGTGLGHRPRWLDALWRNPPEGILGLTITGAWLMLLAHVANTSNFEGRFDPSDPSWEEFSQLPREQTLILVHAYVEAGGLELRDGGFFVRSWAEEYRNDLIENQVAAVDDE